MGCSRKRRCSRCAPHRRRRRVGTVPATAREPGPHRAGCTGPATRPQLQRHPWTGTRGRSCGVAPGRPSKPCMKPYRGSTLVCRISYRERIAVQTSQSARRSPFLEASNDCTSDRGRGADRMGRRFPEGEPAKVHTPESREIVRGRSGHRTYTRSGDACRRPPPPHPTAEIGGFRDDIGDPIGRTAVRAGRAGAARRGTAHAGGGGRAGRLIGSAPDPRDRVPRQRNERARRVEFEVAVGVAGVRAQRHGDTFRHRGDPAGASSSRHVARPVTTHRRRGSTPLRAPVSLAAVDSNDPFAPDVLCPRLRSRGLEVRLADLQVDDVVDRAGEVEDLADPDRFMRRIARDGLATEHSSNRRSSSWFPARVNLIRSAP